MRDPHVVSLRYQFRTGEGVIFDEPEPIRSETEAFHLRLENDVLIVEMKQHYATVEHAREIVEELLRAWEIDAALQYDAPEIRFVFEDAEVIDRSPPPPKSPQTIQLKTMELIAAIESVTVRVTQPEYPKPPLTFTASPDVETLWHRYQGYLGGREQLLPMAYFCLSLIQVNARGREQASMLYRIDREVLDKLGELTSVRGDGKTARKFDRDSTREPLSSAEITWVESAVKAIIRRVGEQRSPTSVPMLTMRDLPRLVH